MEKTTELDGLIQGFQSPDPSCTQIPFWFLNGDIDGQEYSRQIDEMKEHGVKHAMPHPRYGMDRRDYLSDTYFKEFGKLVSHASESGFALHLYDEYNWASGPAGGRVTAKRENCALGINMLSRRVKGECRVTFERSQLEEGFKGWGVFEKIIGAALIPVTEGSANADLARWTEYHEDDAGISADVSAGEYEAALFYTVRTIHPSPLRMGNGGIIDYLSKEPTAEFIADTHEQYYRHFKDEFGKTIKSIFYDETAPYGCGRFSWSKSFAEDFQKIKGYEITEKLPLLFFDGAGCEKVRCDYWDVVTQLFTENHIGQMADWCADHGIALTGHTFEENNRWSLSGDPLSTLRRQQWPGIDSLFGYKPYSCLKAPAAVAHFAKKEVFLCEALGIMEDWEASPANMRKAYHQLAVLGVTHLVPHAFFQTVDNPKVECPPSFFEQNPYWKYYELLAGMTARECYINRQGSHVCDIAILHPIVTWWGDGKGGRGCDYPWSSSYEAPKVKESREAFERLMDELMGQQLDFDVIDSRALNDAKIESGKLNIADERYQILIIPYMRTIRRSDAEKALLFARRGGLVIFAGEYPSASMESGAADKELDDIIDSVKDISVMTNGVSQYIKSVITPDIEVIFGDKKLIDAAHRRVGKTDIYIISHTGSKEGRFGIRLRSAGKAFILDPETGECCSHPVVSATDTTADIELDLPECKLLYVFITNEQYDAVAYQNDKYPEAHEVDISENWSMLPVNESDIGKSPFKAELSVPLFRSIAMSEGDEDGFWRSWFKPEFDDSTWETGHTLRKPALYDHTGSRCFRIPIPAGVTGLKLPLPIEKEYALYINGSLTKVQLFRDEQVMGILPISKSDKSGILAVECSSMAPDFGLTKPFEFITEPVTTNAGDWCKLGYGWYSGWMLYQKVITLDSLDKVILQLGEVRECTSVTVNGRFVAARLWGPYEFDISSFIKKGDNIISVYVCNLLSNRFSWYPLGTRGGGRQLPSGLIGPVTLKTE